MVLHGLALRMILFFFEYDANGSGIMYTEHIKKQIKELEEKSVYDNEKYGYNKLGKNWYGVYR